MKKYLIAITLLLAFAGQSQAQLETHEWKIRFTPPMVQETDSVKSFSFYSFMPMKIENGTAYFPAASISFNSNKKTCYIKSEIGIKNGNYFMADENHLTLIFDGIKHAFTVLPESHHVIYLHSQSGKIMLLSEH